MTKDQQHQSIVHVLDNIDPSQDLESSTATLKSELGGFLEEDRVEQEKYQWDRYARAKQRVPAGSWRTWLILAGRGFGKTRTGSETLRQWVGSGQAKRIALIGATEGEVRDVMIEGDSGLLSIYPPENKPVYESSKGRVTWPNGAMATIFSAENYEKLRGPQFDAAWIDELCKFRSDREVWDQLNFSLRLGKNPRVIITTTPRPTVLLKELLQGEKKGDVHVTTGTTYENLGNLSKGFMGIMSQKYGGTTLGKQELEGKILSNVQGALWTNDLMASAVRRRNDMPEFTRLVVAVDPAITSHGKSDESGIIVAAKDKDNCAYILHDYSGKYTPHGWAKKAIEAYNLFEADCIVAEVNQGGDMVESVVRSIEPTISFKGVHASRGKVLRAEPVLALYEQNRVFHVKGSQLVKLEEQMLGYVPGLTKKSPDRLDALVWAVTELLLPKDLSSAHRIHSLEGE